MKITAKKPIVSCMKKLYITDLTPERIARNKKRIEYAKQTKHARVITLATIAERNDTIVWKNTSKATVKHTTTETATAKPCTALSFVRPSVFSKFELAVLNRSRLQERATEQTRKAREQATAKTLFRANKLQPVETTDCYRAYKPKMKQIKVFRLHDGKYRIVKSGIVPARLHVSKKYEPKTFGYTYKHLYQDRDKVKNMLNPSFVFFPDEKPIEKTSFMYDLLGQWINETALDFVIRALKTQFAKSGHPFIFLLLMQAQKQKYSKGALDYNCEIHTSCHMSTRYRDKLTGRMMQREQAKLVQEIICDDGKMLDYTGKIPGETKVNLEKAVYQDIQDLFGIASLHIFKLVKAGFVSIPSDLTMQKGSVYKTLNEYIKTSKKRWAKEEPYIIENEDGTEEYFLDAETMKYTDEYKSNVQAVLETIKATVAKHTAKQFKLDKAMQAYALSMDYDNTYIAKYMSCDEKQVRRWINTINDSMQADNEFKRLMYNAI